MSLTVLNGTSMVETVSEVLSQTGLWNVQRKGVKSSFHAGFFTCGIKVTEPKKCTVVRHNILQISKEQMKRNKCSCVDIAHLFYWDSYNIKQANSTCKFSYFQDMIWGKIH